MAVTSWLRFFFILLVVFTFHLKGESVLTRGDKQFLLDSHNNARRALNAPNMRAMEWSPGLAEEAERVARTCSRGPADRPSLSSAINNRYSWIGENRLTLTNASSINPITLGQTFTCWSMGSNDCTATNRQQVLYPSSHLIGCGANYFSSNDRCHAIGVGLLVVCFYAPGSITDSSTVSGQGPCTSCPTDAPNCVTGLCAPGTSLTPVPAIPVGTVDPAVPYIYYTQNSIGSYAGGTLYTLIGRGFSSDQFNRDNPSLGNRVVLTNGVYNVSCTVINYYTSTTKITCRTGPSPERIDRNYWLIVTVDGRFVNNRCGVGKNSCRFYFRDWATPYIDRLSTYAIVPGLDTSNITLTGRIYTYRVVDTQEGLDDVHSNYINLIIDRQLIGGELCNPWTDNETIPYGGRITIWWGYGDLWCKPETNRIDSMNASIVTSAYGNSEVRVADLSIDNKLRQYMFQTHSDITRVAPSRGSPEGGTLITIYGRHLSDPQGDVKAYISGVPCRVVNYTSSYIQCITGPAPPNSSVYPGGRGMAREVWPEDRSTYWDLNYLKSRPYGYPNNSYNWTIEERMYRDTYYPPAAFGENVYFQQRYTGFFVPPIDSYYTFNVISDDKSQLYLSPNITRDAKRLIASINSWTTSWTAFASQMSEPIYMKAGEPCYMEGIQEQGGGPWRMGIGVKIHNLTWTQERATVDYETQKINISSVVLKETQKITLHCLPKIQRIKLELDPDVTNNTYRLSFMNTVTSPISQTDNITVISRAINSLQSVQTIGRVHVTINDTLLEDSDILELTFIFISTWVNIPDIILIEYSGEETTDSEILQSKSKSSFKLSFGPRSTSSLPPYLPANNVSQEIINLFTTQCTVSNPGTIIFQATYDVTVSSRGSNYGLIDSSREPYCGRYSTKNPIILWRWDHSRDERDNTRINNYILVNQFAPKYICFASYGTLPSLRLHLAQGLSGSAFFNNFNLDQASDVTEWSTRCIDLYSLLHTTYNHTSKIYRLYQVRLTSSSNEFWIDEFTIGTSKDKTVEQGIRAVRPNGVFVSSVSVTATNITQPTLNCSVPGDLSTCRLSYTCYTVEYTAHNCGVMPLITATPNTTTSVTRLLAGSPPVTGTFDFTFENTTIHNISSSATKEQLKELLERHLSGSFTVSRGGTCFGYTWDITWNSRGGDLPLSSVNGRGLIGHMPSANTMGVREGGVWIRPLRGDMVRLPELQPQVQVSINGIPASCRRRNCDFLFTDDDIPLILSLSPNNGGQVQTPLNIIGKNFGNNVTKVTVTVGNVSCPITTLNDTFITCTPALMSAGPRTVRVHVDGLGYAVTPRGSSHSAIYNYNLMIDSITPKEGSASGGNIVTINGFGFPITNNKHFSKDFYVSFDGDICYIMSSNYTTITCRPQPHIPASVNVTVLVNGVQYMLEDSYEFKSELVTVINSISPSSGPLYGGTTLSIRGERFQESSNVTIGRAPCNVTFINSSYITCLTSSYAPGSYPLLIRSPSYGIAISRNDFNSLQTTPPLNIITINNFMNNSTTPSFPFANPHNFTYQFSVTNISPCRGSLAGNTLLSITGEGFTAQTNVTIGGRPCSPISFISSSLIRCNTPPLAGRQYMIENSGTHASLGQYFAWSPNDLQILQGDTVTWKWIGSRLSTPQTFEVHQTSSLTNTQQLPGGFKSPSAIDGTFTYTFTRPGTYYYTSDLTICNSCFMSGVIRVLPLTNTPLPIRVTAGNNEATYNINNNNDDDIGSGSGHNNNCLPCGSNSSSSNLVHAYSTCDTPLVNRIDPQLSTVYSTISIYGSGFGYNSSQASVMFGSHPCNIIPPFNNELITCMFSPTCAPNPSISLPLSLNITNKGRGILINEDPSHRELVIRPVITGLSPSNGSILGGNELTINGASFISSGLSVYIGDNQCNLTNVSYNVIKCILPPLSKADNNSAVVNVSYTNGGKVVCAIKEEDGGCNYQYSLDHTPLVEDITPVMFGGIEDTLVTIRGELLRSNTLIKFGPYNCTNVNVIDSENITCTIGPMQASRYRVSVLVPEYGYAQFEEEDLSMITSILRVSSFSPRAGSIRGGTILTLYGIGFSDFNSNNTITIANRPCTVRTSNYSTITCTTPDLGGEGNHTIGVTVAMHPLRSKRETPVPLIFSYDLSYTPQVYSVHPSSGQHGDTIRIIGTGFTDSGAMVNIGGRLCWVNTQNDSHIMCTLGPHYVGRYSVDVFVPGKGKANGNVSFNYSLVLTSISPVRGSFAGLNILTLRGIGFDPLATFITVCGRPCASSANAPSLSSITCILPSFTDLLQANNVTCDVNVTSLSNTASLPDSYTLSDDLTPRLTAIDLTRGGTGGGVTLTLTGSGFTSNVNVTIAGSTCTVRTTTSTTIVCVTGPSGRTIKAPVMVYVQDKGYAISTAEQFYYVDVWSSRYTWGGKAPPVEGDFVIVPSGQTLVLDIRTPVLSILLIQGGQLIFDDTRDGVELHSENILIVDGGSLQIGTEEAPHQHKAQIVMYGNRVSTELPLFGAKTLAVRNGTLDLHGKRIINTWTCLSNTVRAGQSVLNVKHNVSDWEVGGTIVIASTSYSRRENEELIIQSISNNGKTITVTTPLQYTHISMVQTIHGKVIETCAEVGYLTRNVVVRGNRNHEWDRNFTNCKDDFDPGQFAVQTCFNGRFGAETIGDQFGSQIMLHKGPKDKVVGRLSYIEVTHAGQAFRLGRYPIHFHLNGDVNGSYVRGCGIHHTFNRAVTIHGVDNLLVEHNVAYNILGHAYFLEDGIEENNIIQYNLGIFIRASSSLLNVDITPATFWSVNPNNIFRHNAAAGGTHFGFWYRLPTNPTGPSFTPHVRPINRPMGQFYNNTAHSFGWYGIWIFPSYYPVTQSSCNNVTPAVFEHFLAWRNVRGVEFSEVGAVQLKHSVMLDNTLAGVEYTQVSSSWGKNGSLIEDVLIVAHSDLKYADNIGDNICTGAGIKAPKSYYLTVSNVTLVNFNKTGCYALQACSHCRTKQGGFETRFEDTILDNSPNIATWKWTHEHVLRDVTGSITGTAGSALIPTTEILPSDKCKHHPQSSFGAVNGSVCEPDVQFTRFAVRNPVPSSLTFAMLHITNSYGTNDVEYVQKRIVHAPGHMAILPTKQEYKLEWDGSDKFTNISYDSLYSGLPASDYLWVRHEFNKSVDVVTINDKKSNASLTLPQASTGQLGDWFISDDNKTVRYFIRGSRDTCPVNVPLKFTTYQCFYPNCIPPPPPEPLPPRPTGRPDVTQSWSNSSIWPNGQLPVNGSDVYINCDQYVLVDVPVLPVLNVLTICGGLEFLDDRHHFLQANRILIDGGQLVAGRNDTPFQHTLTILLNGDRSSHEYRLPNLGPVLGAKGLGVFGHLNLHGKVRRVTWTHLAESANLGTTTLVLKDSVDWTRGEEIVIASTYYEAGQTEERTIMDISPDGKNITINKALDYSHLGGTHNTECCTVDISAEVGLLSRNIKILGTHPNSTNDVSARQSYGCRVLVSTYFNSTRQSFITGTAQLSGVEFKGCGQEGFVETFDPRYSLAFLSTGAVLNNSSYITSCSFHGGYSVGIGLFGAHNMMLTSNVVHRTVGPSFHITGRGHVVRNNLAVVALFPGTYRKPEEPMNAEWTANYELAEASDLLLIGNSAAGGAKAGFHTNGENCIPNDFTPLWSDNIAHSTLHGVHVGYTDGHTNGNQVGCSAFHKFTIYSCYHYGLMAYSGAGVLVTNSTFVNNYAAMFTAVIGPPALSHTPSNKTVIIRDTTIISSIHPSNGGSVNCTEYKYKPAIAYHSRSHSPAIQSPWKGHVGVILTSFTSGKGGFPKFRWTVKHNYPAIAGLTKLINVKFCNFGTHCSSMKEVALMTDPSSEDAQHPVWTERVSYEMGTNSSKFYNHIPNLGSINPSDCVDMDCDGLKKILIRDIDGSFTGNGNKLTSLISKSEFEWNGDRRRGLGDYRIPIAMLSNADGSRIPVNSIYPHKGIYRRLINDTCEWMDHYNSYQCTNIDHMMLIIESLDADTEVRRLSPIGLGASGYIDLINGPQDHGWCGGYTCQERISTFYTIVSTGLNYTVGLTSTNPQRTNFILLNANDNQSIRIGYIYNNPQRLDVYVGSEYIIPTNGYMVDGNLRYRRGNNFEPCLSADPHGTNYYDRNLKTLYIIIRGSAAVRVETTPVIQLGIDLPPITVDEFFEVNLVRNLALLLGIPPNRIRVVEVISASSRKRQTSSRTRVEIEIGDAPSNETTPTDETSNNTPNTTTSRGGPTVQDTEKFEELVNITTKVSEVIQTGELSKEIGYAVLDAQLTQPKPIVSDPTGGQRATNVTGGPQPGDNGTETLTTVSDKQFQMEQEQRNTTTPIVLNIPTRLVLLSSINGQLYEGVSLGERSFRVAMHDGAGNIVKTLGVGLPWQLTASIISSTSSGSFLINETTDIGNGIATFNNLTFSHYGTYRISLRITRPSNANFTLQLPIIIVSRRDLYLSIIKQPPTTANTTFPLSSPLIVHVLDRSTNSLAVNIGWRDRTWYMLASLVKDGRVYGNTLNVTIQRGVATFNGIHINEPGSYRFRFSVITQPSSSHLPSHIDSNQIDVFKYSLTKLYITYNNSYSEVVQGREEEFIRQITRQLRQEFPNVYIYNVTVHEGSVVVAFFATSSDPNNLQNLINALPSSQTATQLSFNNIQLIFLAVRQDPNYPIAPSEPSTEKPNRNLVIIICGAISGAVLLACVLVTIILFCYNCCKQSNRYRKRYDTKELKGKSDNFYSSSTIYSNTPIFDEKDDQYSTFRLKSEDEHSLHNYPPVEYTELNEFTVSNGEKKDGKEKEEKKENYYEKIVEPNIYTSL